MNKTPFRPKHRGWKRQDGSTVTYGTILATQTTPRFFPGLNVIVSLDEFLNIAVLTKLNIFLGRNGQKRNNLRNDKRSSVCDMRENGSKLGSHMGPETFRRSCWSNYLQEIFQCHPWKAASEISASWWELEISVIKLNRIYRNIANNLLLLVDSLKEGPSFSFMGTASKTWFSSY